MTFDSPLRGRRLQRPTRSLVTVGRGALAGAVAGLPDGYTVVAQPAPLAALAPNTLASAGVAVHARGVGRKDLQALLTQVPEGAPVLGIGGGVAMDSAKWLAWTLGVPLVLAPSIVSVDACVTNSVAVREAGQVNYEGFVVADAIVVDTDLVRAAPATLNRAGVGDVLSIHTAVWDWREAAAAGLDRGAPFDSDVAAAAQRILARVAGLAGEVFAVSDSGIACLVEAYADINDLTVGCEHPQMEEGSEHYFAYCLESETGRNFVHGEIVCLGVVLLAMLQGNDASFATRVADEVGVAWRPTDLGLDRTTLHATLSSLPDFVAAAGFPGSVVDLRSDQLRDPAGVDRLLAGLDYR